MTKRYGTFEMVNGAICNELEDENKRLRDFIETITDATGPYPDLDRHPIVHDAWRVLAGESPDHEVKA